VLREEQAPIALLAQFQYQSKNVGGGFSAIIYVSLHFHSRRHIEAVLSAVVKPFIIAIEIQLLDFAPKVTAFFA